MEEIRARMSEIEDQRHPSYVKYPLTDILIIVMCAVLCGLDMLGDLVIYAKSKKDFLAKEFGIELEDVRLFFENADRKDLDSFQTVEKNAGRIEKRVCLKIKGYFLAKRTQMAWIAVSFFH